MADGMTRTPLSRELSVLMLAAVAIVVARHEGDGKASADESFATERLAESLLDRPRERAACVFYVTEEFEGALKKMTRLGVGAGLAVAVGVLVLGVLFPETYAAVGFALRAAIYVVLVPWAAVNIALWVWWYAMCSWAWKTGPTDREQGDAFCGRN